VQVENLLGLDYDRFLRSALLAHGEFARFLKATKADGVISSLNAANTWFHRFGPAAPPSQPATGSRGSATAAPDPSCEVLRHATFTATPLRLEV
jgi:hypothetical protein